MKRFFLIGLLWAFTAGLLQAAPTGALFTQVQGKVTVQAKKGKKTRPALKDGSVAEGESVTTGKDARAVLRLFDGSELEVRPNTSFTLSSLQQPSAKEKILKFKLAFGGLLAKVRKLLTPTSSFEVSAGGVVCGVRGTQFEMDYNPDTHQVDLHVLDGTVYTQYNGHTVLYTGGQNAHFPPDQTGGPSNGTNPPGNSGGSNGQDGGLSLGDLNGVFVAGLGVNGHFDNNGDNVSTNGGIDLGDNTFTDPSVGGAVKLQIQINVNPVEVLP